ncbi:hypothetical protein EJ05DRAFT_447683 [Pseudovirgaria hyperparasitica]|uniref:Peroxisomal membrane protein Pex17 n=1 Tax=Pseudovirgaria hyperparasitica TaxID=470096 RepID=A0A6A6WM93_9PEZI|nr:uncharacterized protein EJ05DRAFT_447683 [Pseudovirgaria hyperparasitica]KAF2763273.1 hypothetical protein EJ05DRAFT_447683 [Pseudovirgaria hyperparasitica]
MPADRLLSTLLRSLQTYTDQQDTPRLLSTAAHLLATLSNPHNISLLTSQLLTAPALWTHPTGLETCLRILSVFHSAAGILVRHHNNIQTGETPTSIPGQISHLSLDDWARAVVRGADERSARWKHLLVLGGLLIGLGNGDDFEIAKGIRGTIEGALVRAVNLSLVERDDFGVLTVALVTNHAFPLIGDLERAQLDYDKLLPVLLGAAFFSSEGYQSAYFLGPIDPDVVEVPNARRFNWLASSPSFVQIEKTLSRPLVSAMGPLSRLIAHAVENVHNPWLVQTLMEDFVRFSQILLKQWRNTKLSQIDTSEEAAFLHEDALKSTIPQLWKLLRSSLFATTIVLRSVLGRILGDGHLASDSVAPVLATQTLHILRNLYFVSSRLGANSFSQYTFTYLTAMDILAQYPHVADSFTKEIRPLELGQIPKNPLDRTLDLFFLNTSEHFTLILPSQTNEELLVAAATPYLAAGGNRNLLPIFEAAHSVMLAVLSAPQSAQITAKHLPFYVDALFKVFPESLSPRQFRVAFKTLLRVTAPPSPLSATQPDLPAILLELIHERALHAPTQPLPDDIASPTPERADEGNAMPPLSEQSILIMTLLDSLPFLPIPLLEEWLPLCADLVNTVGDKAMRDVCRNRFWEVLISGEMDPERSQTCVAWWGTMGGRERLLYGDRGGEENGPFMSGALQDGPGSRESKL